VAAGKAGWYEIIPSARYQSYFDDMVEAIDLFYFICDRVGSFLPLERVRLLRLDKLLWGPGSISQFRFPEPF
jgi:hypothetical protein